MTADESLKKTRILVVEDEPDLSELYVSKLTMEGYDVVLAIDGIEGIGKALHENPDAILLDVLLPKKDGFAVLKELKENEKTKNIPVVILSSTSGEKKGMIFKKSVHSGKAKYEPIVSVAKEVCMEPGKFDAQGERGLLQWIKHFMRHA